jgi:hypothetical protein
MKPEQYSPKAREAFGKSLLDMSSAIANGVVVLIILVPLSLIWKGAFDVSSPVLNAERFWAFMRSPAYFIFLILFAAAVLFAVYARKEGLRHVHEAERAMLRHGEYVSGGRRKASLRYSRTVPATQKPKKRSRMRMFSMTRRTTPRR